MGKPLNFLFVNLNWSRLVSKKTFKIHFTLPPLDLLFLSNFARQAGHETRILDLFVDDPSELASLQAKADWVIVTTTPYHMWQCPNSDWELIKERLKGFPMQKTVLVGLHGSIFPEQT